MEPIQAAGIGITKTFDYGLAITVIILGAIATFFLFKYLLGKCDDRLDKSLEQHQLITNKMAEVVERNTTAHAQAAILMTDIKDTLKDITRI